MPRLNNDQASALVWLFLGVAVAAGSLRYGLGTLDSPGTGFMPFLGGLAITLLSSIGLIHGTLKRKQGVGWKPAMRGLDWEKSLVVLASLLAYTLLLKSLGFFLCTALFIAFLLRAVHPQRWTVVMAGAIATALGAYGIFEVWLKAQLPQGPWGF